MVVLQARTAGTKNRRDEQRGNIRVPRGMGRAKNGDVVLRAREGGAARAPISEPRVHRTARSARLAPIPMTPRQLALDYRTSSSLARGSVIACTSSSRALAGTRFANARPSPRPLQAAPMKTLMSFRPLSAYVLAGVLAVTASSRQQSHSVWSPIVPWGVTLQTDRIYYEVGDTLDARAVIANYTGQATWGWCLVRGGMGCEYSFWIHDVVLDQAVWTPGSGCMFAETHTLYAPGSTRRIAYPIPLVYQNPAGIGTPGASLPPGAYELHVRVVFHGPNRHTDAECPGGNFSAVVPFQIE